MSSRRGPVPAALELEVSPLELPPDGVSSARVVAVIRDGVGGPMAGVPITLRADEVGGELSLAREVSDYLGRVVASYTMPLLCEARRIHFSAEIEWQDPMPFKLERRQWLRVRPPQLRVSPDSVRVKPGSGERIELRAVLEDDAGDPLQGVVLRAEVVDRGGGALEPDERTTDASGSAVFTYTAGPRPAEVRVRVWAEAAPRLARETLVDQGWPHFEVQVTDQPEQIVIRAFKTLDASRKSSLLVVEDVESVQVLHRDRETEWEGPVLESWLRVAALVARCGTSGDQGYEERVALLRQLAEAGRSLAERPECGDAASRLAADAERLAALWSTLGCGGGPGAVVELLGPGSESLVMYTDEVRQRIEDGGGLELDPDLDRVITTLREGADSIAREIRAAFALARDLVALRD